MKYFVVSKIFVYLLQMLHIYSNRSRKLFIFLCQELAQLTQLWPDH